MNTLKLCTAALFAAALAAPAAFADDENKSPLASPFSEDAPGMTPETGDREESSLLGGALGNDTEEREGYDSPTPELSDSAIDATTTGGDAHGD